MKIQVDKIENGTPHAVSARNVRLILKAVPPTWTEGVKEVHISNSLEWRGGLACVFFSRYDGRLTIYSRKVTRKEALHAMLSELAAISLRLDRGISRRPKAVRDRLSKMVAPFMETFSSPVQPNPKHVEIISLEGFRELRFAPFPNDSEPEDSREIES